MFIFQVNLAIVTYNVCIIMQLSLDKHEFELQGSTDRWIFFKSYIRKFVEDLQQSENSQMNRVAYRYQKN